MVQQLRVHRLQLTEMKKLFSILIAVTAVGMSLTACNSGDEAPKQGSAEISKDLTNAENQAKTDAIVEQKRGQTGMDPNEPGGRGTR
jgi:hypothetical protein